MSKLENAKIIIIKESESTILSRAPTTAIKQFSVQQISIKAPDQYYAIHAKAIPVLIVAP
jgi:hypothetical protein